MKKLLILLSVLIMAVTCFDLTGFAAGTGSANDYYGQFTWNVDGNGTLTLSSTAETVLYGAGSENAPWHSRIGSIKKIVISKNITSVGYGTFEGFTAAESIVVGDSVEELESGALCPGESLRTIEIGKGLRSTENSAFETEGLACITVDDGNPYYCSSGGVLYNKDMTKLICYPPCRAGTSYTLPDSVTEIKYAALDGCKNLRELNLPGGLESVSFYGCSSLTDIVIPDKVKELPADVFTGCCSLKTITLGRGIESISCGIFAVPSLTDIIVDDENPYFCDEDGVLFNKDKTEIICCPRAGARSEYTIPEGVVSVAGYAFYFCENLSEIVIPGRVVYVGRCAFSHCGNLSGIVIPGGVTVMGESAFSSCTGLTGIELPDSLEYIGGSAFNYCTSLKELSLPDGITSLENDICACCYSLESVKLPADLLMLSRGCFSFCRSLKSIVIPDGVTYIPEYAFTDAGIESITIPKIESVGGSTFEGCGNLKDVYYAGSVADRAAMDVPSGSGTYCFTNAEWHYNYGKHTSANPVITGIQSFFRSLTDGLSSIVFFIRKMTYGVFGIFRR